MAILLSLLTAVSYGAGDFFGGLASRQQSAVRVTLLSQVLGAAVLVIAIPAVGGEPTADALATGAAAGVAGASALLVFYRAMAVGAMSVIAPVSALTAASLPVMVGLATGERPPAAALVGVVIALGAIVLVSQHGDATPSDPEIWRRSATSHHSTVLLGLLAGSLFGVLFILLDGVPDDAGLWPLLGARAASVPLVALVAVATRTRLRPAAGTLRVIAACGVFDMLANVFLVLAFRHGLLVLVSVITSLYPASTLVLARVVLHERVRRVQQLGLAVAALAVVLISAS